jgi:hypothetical protein
MGVVINGIYYKNEDMAKQPDVENATYKQWSHADQRKNHARDLVQPWKDGKANPAFIEAFPTEAKEVYHFIPDDDQLKKGNL